MPAERGASRVPQPDAPLPALPRRPVRCWRGRVVPVALAMTFTTQLFTRRDPNAIVFLERLQPPSLAHPLGTDENGRDLWVHVVYGARPTLVAAVSLILLSLTVGSLADLAIGLRRPPHR